MKRLFYLILLVGCGSFYACSNEIDLTAPYKDITVVYGLLDAKEDTQWVRIQKAFLGDGDALAFAKISDSLYYDTLVAYMIAYNGAGVKMDSFALERVIDPFPKDSGVFANDINILYRTTHTLNSSYSYRLTVIKPNLQDTTTAKTSLCRNFFMSYPPNSSTIINFEDQFGIHQNPNITVKWTGETNTYAYQLGFRFNYLEWIASDTTNKVLKSFEYYFPVFTVYNPGGGYNTAYYDVGTNMVRYDVYKTDFYGAIVTRIAKDPAGTPSGQLHVRKFYSIDFIVRQASKEFYDYMVINQPSLSFVQKITNYTNVTDGIGIFGSRSSSGVSGLTISPQTKDSLRLGQYTYQLNFQ